MKENAMSSWKRVALIGAVTACLPLVTGGGGMNPPPQNAIVVGPTVEAIVVMDPHEPGVTTTAKRATIWLSRKDSGTAGAAFSVPLFGFPLSLGCDLSMTETRFVTNGSTPVTLDSWMPGDVVTSLFGQIGITVSPVNVPTITAIKQQKCTTDPNPANNEGVEGPGFLVMRVEIGFLIPGGTNPVKVWIGLKNSDDVGVKFDLQATLMRNNTVIGSGQFDSVPGGSSGFNNARLHTIPLEVVPAVDFASGDIVSLEISVRTACVGSGHSSGTARLWFNEPAVDRGSGRNAGSRVLLSIGGLPTDYFLRANLGLSATPGAARLFVDRSAGARCSPFKSFATWSTTLP
jgi:hypothetical protein